MRLYKPSILPTFQRLELRRNNLYRLSVEANQRLVDRLLRSRRLFELNAPKGVLEPSRELVERSTTECERIRAAITRMWAIWDIKTKSQFADEEKAFTR